MTRLAALVLPLLLLACGDAAEPAAPVADAGSSSAAFDTTVVTTLSPGAERGAARLTHTFRAPGPAAPVAWTRILTAGSDTLFAESGTSEGLDGFFEDVSAFEGCATAAACRRQWFVRAFAVPRLDTLAAGPLDAYDREVARGYLLDSGYGEAEADRLLDALDAQTLPRVTLQFTESPVSDGPVWVYHPALRRLLPLTADDL